MCRHLTALSAESIGTLCELTVLNINGAELDDVTPIFNCTKLQELYMDMDDDDDQEIFYIEDDDLQELPRLKNLKKLSLKNQIRLSDQALTYVRHLDNLTDLNMRGCSGYEEHHDQQGNHQQGNPGITDAGMEYICNLPHLRSLDVGDTNVTSTDAISRIVNLRELTLSGSPLTNESIQALKNCKYLELLDLNLCHMLSSAGMSHLQDMNTLMYLYLDETRVGAGVEGIEPLKRLSNLFTLTLNRCPIGDHICTALSKIQTLIVLELEETRISGDGLKELADLPFLQTIDIRSCFEVSEKKLKRFSMMRPDVDIVR
jgi:Leucine-rich repeat (LRR) protein